MHMSSNSVFLGPLAITVMLGNPFLRILTYTCHFICHDLQPLLSKGHPLTSSLWPSWMPHMIWAHFLRKSNIPRWEWIYFSSCQYYHLYSQIAGHSLSLTRFAVCAYGADHTYTNTPWSDPISPGKFHLSVSPKCDWRFKKQNCAIEKVKLERWQRQETKAWNVLLCIPRENKSQFGCSVWYRTCYCLVAGFDVLWFIYLLVGVIIIVILVLIIFCCMWRRWLVIFIFCQFLVCNFVLTVNHPRLWSFCAKEHPVFSRINLLKLRFRTSLIEHLTVFLLPLWKSFP